MKISVYDTYVKKNSGSIMHFDILIEKSKTSNDAITYGKKYLASKKLFDKQLTTKECKFCHVENVTGEIEEKIRKDGYYIIEMENC
ncbi:DUF2024 family protein [Tenacibaculum soleae]|uniref:DUF2024 family protein n=1 Tax=Tenacibaculum soleae TaxID=447689 RepID=UPI0026E457EA|nr:DUF2024 family protein [Tenacibaculum soleae]MDO6812023.1 DUF2024 family protein [Tenacibaculum soleae]